MEADRMACKTCSRPLDRITMADGRTRLIHTIQTLGDHEVVPVPFDSIATVFKCDLCSADYPDYVMPMEPFTFAPFRMMDGTVTSPPWDSRSEGNYAVCMECAPLVERDDWRGIMRRSMDVLKEKEGIVMPSEGRVMVWDKLQQVRRHQIGRLKVRDWSN